MINTDITSPDANSYASEEELSSQVRQAWRQRDGSYCRQWTLAAWGNWV